MWYICWFGRGSLTEKSEVHRSEKGSLFMQGHEDILTLGGQYIELVVYVLLGVDDTQTSWQLCPQTLTQVLARYPPTLWSHTTVSRLPVIDSSRTVCVFTEHAYQSTRGLVHRTCEDRCHLTLPRDKACVPPYL